MHEKQSLYSYILDKISRMNFQDFEYYNLNNYLPEVRQLLLGDLKEQKIGVSLSSNIDSRDTEKLYYTMLKKAIYPIFYINFLHKA